MRSVTAKRLNKHPDIMVLVMKLTVLLCKTAARHCD
jgi:hypothetical protein